MQHIGSTPPLRVCDRCIRKKVKCTFVPFLRGWAPFAEPEQATRHARLALAASNSEYCAVTPPSGASPALHVVRGMHPILLQLVLISNPYLNQTHRPNSDSSRAFEDGLSGGGSTPAHSEGISLVQSDLSPVAGPPVPGNSPRFASQQVDFLLGSYFDNFQDANPIFSKELFFRRYQSGRCAEDLISTIVIITAKLTGFTADEADLRSLDARLDLLLSSSLLEDELIGDTPSLDQFRKAYLLAFYEFHQFPGHHSWLRVGRVTRMAYRIGLDRLDRIRTIYPNWRSVSTADIQEWRWIWWCLYRLDSYSNLSSGAPYLIDDSLIGTSFLQPEASDPAIPDLPEFSLPPSSENLSNILLAATLHPPALLQNIHIVTTAILRQAGLVIRMHLLRSQSAIQTQIRKVSHQLATIRLALPPGWLNPRRNAFASESHNDYHARMITMLHLRMAQLLLSIVDAGQRGSDGEWLDGWERILEPCQDIASIAENWDSSFCLTVDPAISFTLFTALIFLDLHRKTVVNPQEQGELAGGIEHNITVLRLQLGHFAGIWTLSRLLKLSFESFSQSVEGPLSHRSIALILSHFEGPLHPRWLQFLSSAHTVLGVS